jgi:hypothetical protein
MHERLVPQSLAMVWASLTQVASAWQASSWEQQLCLEHAVHASSLADAVQVPPPPPPASPVPPHAVAHEFWAQVASALNAASLARHWLHVPSAEQLSSQVTQVESLLQAVACVQHWAARHVAHAEVPVMAGHEPPPAPPPLDDPELVQPPEDEPAPPIPPPRPPRPPPPQLPLPPLLLEEQARSARLASAVNRRAEIRNVRRAGMGMISPGYHPASPDERVCRRRLRGNTVGAFNPRCGPEPRHP